MVGTKEIRKRTLEGDPGAQCIVGRMYTDDNNYDEGIKWYRLAADQDRVLAKKALLNREILDM